MTNFLATIPRNRFKPVNVYSVEDDNVPFFWALYDQLWGAYVNDVARGALSLTAFDAEDETEVVERIMTDFKLRRRKFIFQVMVPDDSMREAIGAPKEKTPVNLPGDLLDDEDDLF